MMSKSGKPDFDWRAASGRLDPRVQNSDTLFGSHAINGFFRAMRALDERLW
jgi:hypothetical protein